MIKRVPLLLWLIIFKPAKKIWKNLTKVAAFFQVYKKVLTKTNVNIYAVSTLDLFIHEKFKDWKQKILLSLYKKVSGNGKPLAPPN